MISKDMDAKAYLEQYEMYDGIAKRSLAEYKAECEAIESLMKIKVFHEPKDYDKKLKAVASYTKNLHAQADKAIRKRDEVLRVINGIPGIERDILYARYIEQLKWDDMANRFCYSWNGIFKAHDRAIRMLQDHLCGCSAVDQR